MSIKNKDLIKQFHLIGKKKQLISVLCCYLLLYVKYEDLLKDQAKLGLKQNLQVASRDMCSSVNRDEQNKYNNDISARLSYFKPQWQI